VVYEPGSDEDRRRLENSRDALAYLTSYVIHGGPGSMMTSELLKSMIWDDPTKPLEETAMKLVHGMTYVARELLAMREAEVGKTPAETLEELGRIFHPHPPGE
jgi:hypothetical protein